MHYEHTPGLTRALSRAAAWASSAGQGEIHADHLLRALVEDEEAQPSTLLARAGLARETIVRELCPPPLPADTAARLPLADGVGQIFREAQRLAFQRSEEATLA